MVKNMAKIIYNNIRSISPARMAVYIILIAFLSINSVNYINYGGLYEYESLIYSQTNDVQYLCVYLLFVNLVVVGDFMMNNVLHNEKLKVRKIVFCKTISGMVLSAILTAIFFLLNLCIYLIMTNANKYGFILNVPLFIHSVALYYLRLISIVLFVYCINSIAKSKIYAGVFSVIFIALFEIVCLDWLLITKPIFILPIEHSLVSYAFIYGIDRVEFISSYLYWAIIITVLSFIVYKKTSISESKCEEL